MWQCPHAPRHTSSSFLGLRTLCIPSHLGPIGVRMFPSFSRAAFRAFNRAVSSCILPTHLCELPCVPRILARGCVCLYECLDRHIRSSFLVYQCKWRLTKPSSAASSPTALDSPFFLKLSSQRILITQMFLQVVRGNLDIRVS
jgi:hypothetical protein